MAHYYDKDGKPCHTQITASGKNKGGERPTTVRDARKLGLFPSVSEINNVLSKDGLNDWKVEQALRHSYQLVKDQTAFLFDEDGFVDHAKAELDNQSSGYAQVGTDIHASVECYLRGMQFDPNHMIFIEGFNRCMDDLCKVNGTTPENRRIVGTEFTFAVPEKYGFGGSVDQVWEINGQYWVTDLKCKQSKPGKPFYMSETYPIQMAAYAQGIHRLRKDAPGGDKMPRIANVLVSATEPGRCELVIYSEEEQKSALEMFTLLREVWYRRNW